MEGDILVIIIAYLARVVFMLSLIGLVKKIRDEEETVVNTWMAVISLLVSMAFEVRPLF